MKPLTEFSNEELERELMRRNSPSGCTGVAAVWCPSCGDCTCEDREDLNDDDCPLHSMSSPHAERGLS